jgi:hypothetical protein
LFYRAGNRDRMMKKRDGRCRSVWTLIKICCVNYIHVSDRTSNYNESFKKPNGIKVARHSDTIANRKCNMIYEA